MATAAAPKLAGCTDNTAHAAYIQKMTCFRRHLTPASAEFKAINGVFWNAC
jgi:hypothetical protein